MTSHKAFKLTTDDHAPEFIKGDVLIVDPQAPPTEGCWVVVDLGCRGGRMLSRWLGTDGRDGNGRFCRKGSDQEMFVLGNGLSYDRAMTQQRMISVERVIAWQRTEP